jgi:hypothetical protein
MPGLSDLQKVLLSVLKKVYMQAGGGRREGAFARGLNPKQRELVGAALDLLQSAGMIAKGKAGTNVIYVGVKGQANRVRSILASGAASNDPVLKDAK